MPTQYVEFAKSRGPGTLVYHGVASYDDSGPFPPSLAPIQGDMGEVTCVSKPISQADAMAFAVGQIAEL